MLNESTIRELLQRVAQGQQSVDQAVTALRHLPYEQTEFATVDHHRALRQGFGEVVFCGCKTPGQVAEIMVRLSRQHDQVLGTRAEAAHFQAVRERLPEAEYHELGRVIRLDRKPDRPRKQGVVLVSAGTGDLPVAEEATLCLDLMGHAARRITDVGVAGLHRLLPHVPALQSANVVIVIAGMDGALPSVVGGLVACPVVAVPTSVGYGASFNGLAALLSMLNSCAAGLAVVNIDNGYGAAHLAASINNLAHRNSGRSAGGGGQ